MDKIVISNIEEILKNEDVILPDVEDFLKKEIWFKRKDKKARHWTGQLYEGTDMPVCIGDRVSVSIDDLDEFVGVLFDMDDENFLIDFSDAEEAREFRLGIEKFSRIIFQDVLKPE